MYEATVKRVRCATLFLVFSSAGCGCGGKHNAEEYFNDSKVAELSNAASRGDVSEIDRLVDEGVDINAKGKDGVRPLLFPLVERNKAGFRRLLEHGANPNLQDDQGESIISFAARIEDDSEWLEIALKHKGNPNIVDKIGQIKSDTNITPLYRSIGSRSIKNIQVLVAAGANLDHRNSLGQTPVMAAVDKRWYRAVYLLLQAGADVSLKDKFGKDVAYYCFFWGAPDKDFVDDSVHYQKVLEFLKAKGVDLDAARRDASKNK